MPALRYSPIFCYYFCKPAGRFHSKSWQFALFASAAEFDRTTIISSEIVGLSKSVFFHASIECHCVLIKKVTSPYAGPLLLVGTKPELSAASMKRSLSATVSTPSTCTDIRVISCCSKCCSGFFVYSCRYQQITSGLLDTGSTSNNDMQQQFGKQDRKMTKNGPATDLEYFWTSEFCDFK